MSTEDKPTAAPPTYGYRSGAAQWIVDRVAADEAAGIDGNDCTAGGVVAAYRKTPARRAAERLGWSVEARDDVSGARASVEVLAPARDAPRVVGRSVASWEPPGDRAARLAAVDAATGRALSDAALAHELAAKELRAAAERAQRDAEGAEATAKLVREVLNGLLNNR